jgi:hypothetical protein
MNGIEKALAEIKKLHLEITELETALKTKKERGRVLSEDIFRGLNLEPKEGGTLASSSFASLQPKYVGISITSTIKGLVESSPYGLTVREIVNEIYDTKDEQTIRMFSRRIAALLSRLTREGKVIRVSKGVYKSR